MILVPVLTTAEDMTGTYLNYLWVSLAIIAALCGMIWWGWRNRKRRQSHVPAPEDIPAALLDDEPLIAAEGMVVGTVSAGDYLDRVAVHQLGIRTTGRVEVHSAGISVLRAGARNWFIPATDLTHVRTDRGVVGKFVERDGLIIIGWQLGEVAVETGFRPRQTDVSHQIVTTVETVISDTPAPSDGGTPGYHS